VTDSHSTRPNKKLTGIASTLLGKRLSNESKVLEADIETLILTTNIPNMKLNDPLLQGPRSPLYAAGILYQYLAVRILYDTLARKRDKNPLDSV